MKPCSSTRSSTNWLVKIAFVFCFKFKTHALSNSRVSVLRDNFLRPRRLLSVVPTHLFIPSPTLRPPSWWLMTGLITDVNNFVLVYSSTQRNIVLLCKLRIPESKLLALFKPLRITFFHHFVVFQSFKTSCSGERWPPYCFIQMTSNQAQNACDWGLHI